jgi:hypothetical protein
MGGATVVKQRHEERDPVDIDDNDLAAEWNAQPRMMKHACRLLADAENDELEAKDRVKLMEAKLALGIRKMPESYGWTGSKTPTEASVEALLTVQPQYQEALREYREAKHRAELLKADVTALHQKKAALENAVILWCRDYGAECKLPKEHSHAARERLEEQQWRGRTPKIEREDG